MHEPITQFPRGEVVGSLRLAKRDHTVDVTRLEYGSRTRFVEKVTTKGRNRAATVTAFRKSDDFPSAKVADRYINEWVRGRTENQDYKIIHEDASFRGRGSQEAKSA